MSDNNDGATAGGISRPWTPGPWRVRGSDGSIGCIGLHGIEADFDYNDLDLAAEDAMAEADANLVALAPEMAEAILATWEFDSSAYAKLKAVAGKLRQIGAKCIDGSCCDDEGCRARLGEDAHA